MTRKWRNAAMAFGLAPCLALLCFTLAGAGTIRNPHDLVPTGKGWGEQKTNSSSTTISGYGINYHGGPLMLGTPNVYFIWYGNWNGSGSNSAATVNLLDALFGSTGLNGSGYEAINTTYFQEINTTTPTYVSGDVVLAAQTYDNYSQGKQLTDSKVQAIVVKAIQNGLPFDSNGIYFVLTSSDVSELSGFCSKYCGWHTHANLSISSNRGDIKYSFVGNPDRCPRACEAQTTSPNNDSGADGMANVMAHEQEEAISDPDLNAWYDSSGSENADKCAWQFGTTSIASNGSQYNQTLAGYEWLIQMNWGNVPTSGQCLQSY